MRADFTREELEDLDNGSIFPARGMVEIIFAAFVAKHPAPEPVVVPLPLVGLGLLVLMIGVAAVRYTYL